MRNFQHFKQGNKVLSWFFLSFNQAAGMQHGAALALYGLFFNRYKKKACICKKLSYIWQRNRLL